jgi:hypothetical protein
VYTTAGQSKNYLQQRIICDKGASKANGKSNNIASQYDTIYSTNSNMQSIALTSSHCQ